MAMNNAVGRYQMVLAECPATRKEAWGKVLGSGNSLKELFGQCGWRESTNWDQVVVVKDTKANRVMTYEEYRDLVLKLMDDHWFAANKT